MDALFSRPSSSSKQHNSSIQEGYRINTRVPTIWKEAFSFSNGLPRADEVLVLEGDSGIESPPLLPPAKSSQSLRDPPPGPPLPSSGDQPSPNPLGTPLPITIITPEPLKLPTYYYFHPPPLPSPSTYSRNLSSRIRVCACFVCT